MMEFYDVFDHRQSQAGTRPRRLGGKERVEDFGQFAFGNASAGILDFDQCDVLPAPSIRCALNMRLVQVLTRNVPPAGIACMAFINRLMKTCWSWLRSNTTDGSFSASSLTTWMRRWPNS